MNLYSYVQEDLPTTKYRGGYVYLIEAKGIIMSDMTWLEWLFPLLRRRPHKIGRTNNLERRLAELNGSQAPCPLALKNHILCDDMYELESQLHEEFEDYRLDFGNESSSSEWFAFNGWESATAWNRFNVIKLKLIALRGQVANAGRGSPLPGIILLVVIVFFLSFVVASVL